MNYFRLKPSTITGAGVGVFSTSDIPRGTRIPELFGEEEVQFLTWSEFAALDLPEEFKQNFPTRFDEGCYLPKNLNQMSAGWFLNHSSSPNLAHDADYVYYALRDISRGEELLIDYDRI